ncbi:MAG: hypothetical protein ACHQD7_03875 [Chitinophagales bacterium]
MAVQSGMGFTGRAGNLIYYEMRGKYYVRSVPARVRQTKATKVRASQFGRAAAIGKAIREQLSSVISNPKNNKMQTRLVSAVFQWLRSDRSQRAELINNLDLINAFNFSDQAAGIQQRWKVALQVSNPSPGLLQIKIPAFIPKGSIVAPAHTISVICTIATAVCDTATAIGGSSTELIFNHNATRIAAQTISIKLPTPDGSLIVTGVSLAYMISKNGIAKKNINKAFMPAGIVDAIFI